MQGNGPKALDVDEIMRCVRDELARRRGGAMVVPAVASSAQPPAASMPVWRFEQGVLSRMPSFAPSDLVRANEYSLDQLLAFHDRQFVRQAYLAILRRPPDTDGETHYTTRLRTGALTKTEVLGCLRYSPEGKLRKVRIKGLLVPLVVQRVSRLPLIGYFLSLCNLLLRLPVLARNFQVLESHALFVQSQLGEVVNRHADEVEAAQERMAVAVKAQVQSSVEPKADVAELIALARRFEVLDAKVDSLQTLERRLDGFEATVRSELSRALEQGLRSLSDKLEGLRSREEERERETLSLRSAEMAFRLHLEAKLSMAETSSSRIVEHIERLDQVVMQHDARLNALIGQDSRHHFEELRDALTALGGSMRSEQGIMLESIRSLTSRQDSGEMNSAALGERLSAMQAYADANTAQTSSALMPLLHIPDAVTQLRQQVQDQRVTLLDMQRRIALLLEEARKRLPEPISHEQLEALTAEEDHLLDAFYVSFEDQFRGARADIKRRATYYLPILRAADVGTAVAPVLDLGCGRGEWLELLREEGLVGEGVDLNRVFVRQGAELGLKVHESDAIAALRALKPNSLGAVTAMHLVEHLSFRTLVTLFDEALRVLRPGGLIVFETPNPENITVGACSFYIDPTHRNPLPPILLQYVAEARGFVGAEIHRLSEHRGLAPERAEIGGEVPGAREVNQALAALHGLLAAAPDYALVARKA